MFKTLSNILKVAIQLIKYNYTISMSKKGMLVDTNFD